MGIWKRAVLFYIGGCVYMALELLWRGWSHGSMFLAGGMCFVLLGHLNAVRPRLTMPMRVLTGTAVITMVELTAGLLVNRDYTVWDYRDQPGNFLGQICPGFILLWLPLAWAALVLYELLDSRLDYRAKTVPFTRRSFHRG